MKASVTAIPTLAYASAAAINESPSFLANWPTMAIQCPGGVPVAPALSAQKSAMVFWSAERDRFVGLGRKEQTEAQAHPKKKTAFELVHSHTPYLPSATKNVLIPWPTAL